MHTVVQERDQRYTLSHTHLRELVKSVVSGVMIEPCATKVDTSLCFHNKLADKELYIVAC